MVSPLDLAIRFERDAAGQIGPKDCQPLIWSPPQRIARTMPLWGPPKVTPHTLTSTPQQILQPNPHRGTLIFKFHAPPGSQGAGYAQVCLTQAGANNVLPDGVFGLSWPMGGGAEVTHFLSYEQHGAITTDGWWGVTSAGQTCRINVYERNFYG